MVAAAEVLPTPVPTRPAGRAHRFGAVLVTVACLGAVTCADVPAAHAADGGERVAIAATPSGQGYWVVNGAGSTTAFGDASDLDLPVVPDAPVVAMVASGTGDGLWIAAADGGVFALGTSRFSGSAVGLARNAPIVDIEPTPDGGGYWLLAADGGVFAFGSAHFAGSAADTPWSSRFVAIEATTAGDGYWLVRADGAVHPFGAASTFVGPASVIRGLRAPIVDAAAAPDDGGLWLAAADGGVFAFGPRFHGSAAGIDLRAPVSSIAATPNGEGYWLLAEDGGVFAFGGAPYRGSAVDPRGPNAVAVARGREVTMEPGGSCWHNTRGGVCSSTLGPGPGTPRLSVARGDVITIRFLLDASPRTLTASTAPWGTDRHRAFRAGASNPTSFRVGGPPGDYLLAIGTTWQIERPYDSEGGDASHYLRVRVTAP